MRRERVARGFLVGTLVVTAVAAAQGETLRAGVGPEFTISFVDAQGAAVTRVDPGEYDLVIDDLAELHSFHLVGPGVDIRTGIESTGSSAFALLLIDGTYRFFCDVHADRMNGSFRVGAPPPPPAARLTATVGPRASIALRRGSVRVTAVPAGRYVITVRDRSRSDNFHLRGAGVDRRTPVAARVTSTWSVTLRRGATYTFRSDAHPRLRGSVRAV